MDKKKIFILSGFLSFLFYFTIFLSLFLYFLENKEEIKKFSIKQKSIEVSLIEQPKIKSPKKIEKKIEKRKEKILKKRIKKRVGSKSAKEEVDIKKLFSNVKISSKSKKVKKIAPKKELNRPSRFKGEGIKKASAKDILKNMNIKNVSKILAKANIEAVKGEDDPYLSKIYEILYKYWLPSQESAGNRAKVKIVIDKDGNFDYKILLYSDSEIFNKELVEYLEYLKSKSFPPPNEEEKEIVVYFEAK